MLWYTNTNTHSGAKYTHTCTHTHTETYRRVLKMSFDTRLTWIWGKRTSPLQILKVLFNVFYLRGLIGCLKEAESLELRVFGGWRRRLRTEKYQTNRWFNPRCSPVVIVRETPPYFWESGTLLMLNSECAAAQPLKRKIVRDGITLILSNSECHFAVISVGMALTNIFWHALS